ncbi:unnamed protein product [Blepharisma stoltei]|uniref:Transmembrane protein n=1 Tax=Blepharisma stoltei TaxID=1481888 RepID=A0AAU9J5I5_9CILI|nr:unnamed protein product [Blepharisma stoltei]
MEAEDKIKEQYQESNFRETQNLDQSVENPRSPFILIPKGSQSSSRYQTIDPNQTIPSIAFSNQWKSIKFDNIIKLSIQIKFLALLDMFGYLIIYPFIHLWMISFIFYAIFGIASYIYMNRKLLVCYIVFIIIVLFSKAFFIDKVNWIMKALLIAHGFIEGVILSYSVEFCRGLATLSPQELLEVMNLREMRKRIEMSQKKICRWIYF